MDEAGKEVEGEAEEETENGALNEAEIKAWTEAGSEAVGETGAKTRDRAVEETGKEAGGSQGVWQWNFSGRGREAGNYQPFLQIFLLPANASFSSYSSSTYDDVNMSSHTLVSL